MPLPSPIQPSEILRYTTINIDSTTPRFQFTRHLLFPFVVASLCLGAAYLAFGITVVEKSLSELAMPVGFVWLALIMWVYISLSLKQRITSVIAAACLAIIWCFGNFYVANELSKSLEQPYLGFDLQTIEKLDTVFVLGGGTTTNLNAHPQLDGSGDRIAMAAQVFSAGKTDQLICTGSQTYRSSPDDLDTNAEAKQLLTAFGIPNDAIDTVPGINTFREMQNIKEWLTNHPEVKRIGILTSAWHLQRAMRLAKQAGIDATPIPSDFHSRHPVVAPDWIIPTSNNLNFSSAALKEYLAALVGR